MNKEFKLCEILKNSNLIFSFLAKFFCQSDMNDQIWKKFENYQKNFVML